MGKIKIEFTPEDLDVLGKIREVCNNSKCSKCFFYDNRNEECPFYSQPYQWKIGDLFDKILDSEEIEKRYV